jgi:hypothetical protein
MSDTSNSGGQAGYSTQSDDAVATSAGNTSTPPNAAAHRMGKGANRHPQEKAIMGKHLAGDKTAGGSANG